MELPWWDRMWVVQEVVLAKEIWLVCGKRALNWDEVVSLAAALSTSIAILVAPLSATYLQRNLADKLAYYSRTSDQES